MIRKLCIYSVLCSALYADSLLFRINYYSLCELLQALDQKCEVCGSENDPGSTLLCDGCDGGFHTYCLVPKVSVVPQGEWYCPRCAKVQVETKAGGETDEPFGFKDGPRYSLAARGTPCPTLHIKH